MEMRWQRSQARANITFGGLSLMTITKKFIQRNEGNIIAHL